VSGAPTFLDLFCGCGGFSLGMERAGFRCLAAVDFNPEAVATFRENFPGVAHALERDLTQFPPEALADLIGADRVDVLTGGPPCQGFSGARKVDGANHGERLKDDPRRLLFREYLRYVAFFQPRVFVMENVLGLQTAAGGEYFTRVQHEARLLGYRVVAQVADAFALGVPQKRRRQLIVGVRGDLPGFFPTHLAPAPRALPGVTLGAAIGDLPPLASGEGDEGCNYDFALRRAHLAEWGSAARHYLYRVLEIADSPLLTAHRARPHSARDLRDFARLREGESSAQAMRRGVEFEWPYSKAHFKDRYTRQSRRAPCSTIVAHLSKDGLMFIHPTQNRSLTPREAARIQSFPDWFVFPVARTHQFRLIGNAVPPLVAEAVGLEVRAFLGAQPSREPRAGARKTPASLDAGDLIPRTAAEAAAHLQKIAGLDRRQLRACDKALFLRGWFALFYLFPGLHPDNALDHGDPASLWSPDQPALPGLEDFVTRRFARSGWPVALELLGREAWRRYESGLLAEGEFYCAAAQMAGMQGATTGSAQRRETGTHKQATE
jgi:DNA (cytosine-5)-methyltransferase 1